MQNIPRELYDAAKIDNANALQRLWHVTVPMLRPVIVLVIVLNTINGIKVFDQIWVMTAGGPESRQRHARHLSLQHLLRRHGQLQPAAGLRHRHRHRHPRAELPPEHPADPSREAPGNRIPTAGGSPVNAISQYQAPARSIDFPRRSCGWCSAGRCST